MRGLLRIPKRTIVYYTPDEGASERLDLDLVDMK